MCLTRYFSLPLIAITALLWSHPVLAWFFWFSPDVEITEVSAAYGSDDEVVLEIEGSGLLRWGRYDPYISIGHNRAFTILEATDKRIALVTVLPAGDYLLRLSHTSTFSSSRTASYDFTVGEIGFTGPKGLSGEDGPDGVPGVQGPGGPVGPTGPVGPRGLQGEKGLVGPEGEAGESGSDGKIGEGGSKGSKGDPGDRGPAGEPGPLPKMEWAGTSLTIVGDAGFGPPETVDLVGLQTGLDISYLCTLATFKYLQASIEPLPKNDEFGFDFPLEEFQRICLQQCPVAFSNFVHLANKKLWRATYAAEDFVQDDADLLLDSLAGLVAPMFCSPLIENDWDLRLDSFYGTLPLEDGSSQYNMSGLVEQIIGDGSQYTWIGNFHRGYVDQPYPERLEDLCANNPWTEVNWTSPIPFILCSGPNASPPLSNIYFIDGWGNKLVYFASGMPDLAFSITSKGLDGVLDTADDIRYDSLNGFTPLQSGDQRQHEVMESLKNTGFSFERLRLALEQFAREFGNGAYPGDLNALVTRGLLDELPTDAWNKEIGYELPTDGGFILSSPAAADTLLSIFSSFYWLDETEWQDILECTSGEICIDPTLFE